MRHKQTQKKRSLSTIIKVKIPRDFTIEREYFKLRVSRQTFTKEKTVEMALQYVWSLDKDHIPGNTTRQSREMKKHRCGVQDNSVLLSTGYRQCWADRLENRLQTSYRGHLNMCVNKLRLRTLATGIPAQNSLFPTGISEFCILGIIWQILIGRVETK